MSSRYQVASLGRAGRPGVQSHGGVLAEDIGCVCSKDRRGVRHPTVGLMGGDVVDDRVLPINLLQRLTETVGRRTNEGVG
jgi:hypothetical protein